VCSNGLDQGSGKSVPSSSDMGAHILPPVPSFYHRPKSIQDIIDQTIGKIFDYMGIRHDHFQRWGEDADTGQRIHPLPSVVPSNAKRCL
jgi:4-hydroxy-3-polyprenylbenzoate decarboxylase